MFHYQIATCIYDDLNLLDTLSTCHEPVACSFFNRSVRAELECRFLQPSVVVFFPCPQASTNRHQEAPQGHYLLPNFKPVLVFCYSSTPLKVPISLLFFYCRITDHYKAGWLTKTTQQQSLILKLPSELVVFPLVPCSAN